MKSCPSCEIVCPILAQLCVQVLISSLGLATAQAWMVVELWWWKAFNLADSARFFISFLFLQTVTPGLELFWMGSVQMFHVKVKMMECCFRRQEWKMWKMQFRQRCQSNRQTQRTRRWSCHSSTSWTSLTRPVRSHWVRGRESPRRARPKSESHTKWKDWKAIPAIPRVTVSSKFPSSMDMDVLDTVECIMQATQSTLLISWRRTKCTTTRNLHQRTASTWSTLSTTGTEVTLKASRAQVAQVTVHSVHSVQVLKSFSRLRLWSRGLLPSPCRMRPSRTSRASRASWATFKMFSSTIISIWAFHSGLRRKKPLPGVWCLKNVQLNGTAQHYLLWLYPIPLKDPLSKYLATAAN